MVCFRDLKAKHSFSDSMWLKRFPEQKIGISIRGPAGMQSLHYMEALCTLMKLVLETSHKYAMWCYVLGVVFVASMKVWVPRIKLRIAVEIPYAFESLPEIRAILGWGCYVMWLGTCCPWKCKLVARMGCQKTNDVMKDTGIKMIKNVSIPVFRIWLAPMERSKLLNHVEPFISHEMCLWLFVHSQYEQWLVEGHSIARHFSCWPSKFDARIQCYTQKGRKWQVRPIALSKKKKKVKAAVVELLHVQYMCLLAVILSEERCVVSARRPGWWSVLNVEKMMQG